MEFARAALNADFVARMFDFSGSIFSSMKSTALFVHEAANTYDANSTYEPSPIVKSFHYMPHITSDFNMLKDTHFQITEESPDNEYTRSVIIFPVVLGIIGFIFVGIALSGVFGNKAWDYVFPPIKPIDHDEFCEKEAMSRSSISIKAWGGHTGANRRFWMLAFFITAGVSILFEQLLFVGDVKMNQGATILVKNMKLIEDSANSIGEDILLLYNLSYRVESSLIQSFPTCTSAKSLQPDLNLFRGELQSFEYLINNVTHLASHFEEVTKSSGIKYKSIVLGVSYSLLMTTTALILASFYYRSKVSMQASITAQFFVVFCLIGLLTVVMSSLIIFADFCMDPTANVVGAINPNNTDYVDIAKFYGSCSGVNPILTHLGRSYYWRTNLGVNMNKLYNPEFCSNNCVCPQNSALKDSYIELVKMSDRFLDIHAGLECSVIHPIWTRTFETALCQRFYHGLFDLWLTITLSLVACCSLSVASTYLLHYFDELWEVDHDNTHYESDDDDNGVYVLDGEEQLSLLIPGTSAKKSI